MKNETNTAPVISIAKAPRQKSPETALKQEMAAINRDLAKLEKTVAAFADIKKEFDAAETRKVQLNTQLGQVKSKLRTALGLD